MTTKQKEAKLKKIDDVLCRQGWEKDPWDNYKKYANGTQYRIKIQKTSIRLEAKSSMGQWTNVRSDYISNVVVNDDEMVIQKLSTKLIKD